MILRALYIGLCTLVLAGIVHVAIVLLIPAVGTRDAYAIVSAQTRPFEFRVVDPEKGEGIVSDVDPFFAYGVCRFEIGETGMALRGPDPGTIWSATIIDEDGGVVYSLSSRTAIQGRLDLILLDPVLTLRLRESQPADIENSIVVESPMKAGFVVLRAFRPDQTWVPIAREFLEGVRCDRYVPPAASPGGGAAEEDPEAEDEPAETGDGSS